MYGRPMFLRSSIKEKVVLCLPDPEGVHVVLAPAHQWGHTDARRVQPDEEEGHQGGEGGGQGELSVPADHHVPL